MNPARRSELARESRERAEREHCAAAVQHNSAKRESRVVRGGNKKWTQRCSVKANIKLGTHTQ